MVLIEQVKKCQTQSLLAISVCGKILQKSPFSSMYEPVRLILLNVFLEMGLLAPKNRIILHSTKNLRKNQVSYYIYCSHLSALTNMLQNHLEGLSALRLAIILSYLYLSQTYTFIIHLISLLKIIMNYAKL